MKLSALLLLVLAVALPVGAQTDAVWRQGRLLRQSGNLAGAYAMMEAARKDASNPGLVTEFILTAVQLPAHRAEGERTLAEMRTGMQNAGPSPSMEEMEHELGGIYSRMARDGGETEKPFRAASIEAYRREELWIARNQGNDAAERLAEARIHRGLELLLANDTAKAEQEIRMAQDSACGNNTHAQLCGQARQAMTAVQQAASVRSYAAAPAEGPKDEE